MPRVAIKQTGVSGRAYDRILKRSRTVVDTAWKDPVGVAQVVEAVQYHPLDRKACS